jgi:hypothetical protein
MFRRRRILSLSDATIRFYSERLTAFNQTMFVHVSSFASEKEVK